MYKHAVGRGFSDVSPDSVLTQTQSHTTAVRWRCVICWVLYLHVLHTGLVRMHGVLMCWCAQHSSDVRWECAQQHGSILYYIWRQQRIGFSCVCKHAKQPRERHVRIICTHKVMLPCVCEVSLLWMEYGVHVRKSMRRQTGPWNVCREFSLSTERETQRAPQESHDMSCGWFYTQNVGMRTVICAKTFMSQQHTKKSCFLTWCPCQQCSSWGTSSAACW